MAGQVGWKTETTWGTGVTVDTFVPVLGFNYVDDPGYIRSEGIRGGRRTQAPGTPGRRVVTGTMEMELPNVSLASLMKHMFGTVATTGAGPTYTHTYSSGPHVSKSQTVQCGIESSDGITNAFTLSGAKIGGWTLGCAVGEFAKLSVDYTAKTSVTATALATATYPATLSPFTFVQGSISVGGTAVASANSVTMTCAKNLRDDRHTLGSTLIMEQLEDTHFEYTTEIGADFENLTAYNLALSGAQVASVLTFTNATAGHSLTITGSGQVTGDAPQLTRIGLEEQTIKLQHSSSTTDAAAVTAVLVTADVTAV